MSSPVLAVLERCLGYAEEVCAGIGEEQRHHLTPCAGFTVEQLAAHLVSGVGWFAALAEGGPTDPAELPGPDLSGQPLRESLAGARDAVRATWTPDRLEVIYATPRGKVRGDGLAQYMVVEILGHGWDLAVATRQPARPAEDLATTALGLARELGETLRYPGGMGPPVPVPPDATATERFVAYLGRDPAAERPAGRHAAP